MGTDAPPPATPEERLERGEVLVHAEAPFVLPGGDDRAFLLGQRLAARLHKNISYDPSTGRVSGFVRAGEGQEERLRAILGAFSQAVTEWVCATFPRYTPGLGLDRVSFRPLEEATRRARPTARNDLLHIDAFPNRPSHGRRLLRVFVNLSPTEPRVWATSEAFRKLLARHGGAAQPGAGWLRHLGARVLSAFRPAHARASAFDHFMLRFHDHLKSCDEVQTRSPRRLWTFPPGSAWLAMTDACLYAELRGQFALEHSYFLDPSCLALPAEAPAALVAAAGLLGWPGRRAA
jgi:hypothetical protein